MRCAVYEYIQITLDYSPLIWGTNEKTVEWIVEEIKNRYKRLYTSRGLLNEFRNKDGLFYIHLDASNFPKEGPLVSQWILKMLLQKGYEPFAADGQTIHLRLKISTE